jgi:hypothetical protein
MVARGMASRALRRTASQEYCWVPQGDGFFFLFLKIGFLIELQKRQKSSDSVDVEGAEQATKTD